MCNLLFSLCFAGTILVYVHTKNMINLFEIMTILIFSFIIILTECPVENDNVNLSAKKKKTYKLISLVLYICFGIISIILYFLCFDAGVIIVYTLALISVFVIVATLQKIKRRCDP